MNSRRVTIIRRALTISSALTVALFVVAGPGSALTHSRNQRALDRSFRALAANAQLAPLTDSETGRTLPTPSGTPVALLEIPRVGVREVVIEGSTPNHTVRGPGHVASTPLPGQFGNAVIVGRRTTFGAPFRSIDSLRSGDPIYATTSGGRLRYNVTAVRTVSSNDTSLFKTDTAAGNFLTLVTAASALSADNKIVVQAKLDGQPRGFSPSKVAPTAAALGVASDAKSWAPLAFSLQLLLALSLGAVWMYRRFGASLSWIVASPVLLAGLWLVCEQFVRALPGSI